MSSMTRGGILKTQQSIKMLLNGNQCLQSSQMDLGLLLYMNIVYALITFTLHLQKTVKSYISSNIYDYLYQIYVGPHRMASFLS